MGQQVPGSWIHTVTEEAIYSRGQFCDVGLEVSSESSTRVFLSRLFEDFADQSPVESLCAQMSWSHYHLKQTLSQTSVQRSELHGT